MLQLVGVHMEVSFVCTLEGQKKDSKLAGVYKMRKNNLVHSVSSLAKSVYIICNLIVC